MTGKTLRRRRRWIRRRQQVRTLLAQLRSAGACQLCGEDDPLVLDFHHVDPATKRFAVGDFGRRSVSVVRAEVCKCAIICANCHRRVNAGTVDAAGLVPVALPGAAPLAAAP
jgi:5-methylcytosine-specific restriction endonuclease McrA